MGSPFVFPSAMFSTPESEAERRAREQNVFGTGMNVEQLQGRLGATLPGLIGQAGLEAPKVALEGLMRAPGMLWDSFIGDPYRDVRGPATSTVAPTMATDARVLDRSKTMPSAAKEAPQIRPTLELPSFPQRPQVFPEPAALPAFTPPPRGNRIGVIRDSNGRVVSASTIEGKEAEPDFVGPPQELIERTPDDPVFGRIHGLVSAIDTRDVAGAETAFAGMTPFEQQLARERIMELSPMLAQRQRERELSQAERARRDDVALGLEAQYGSQLIRNQAAKQAVLQDKSPKEWIDDRGLVYAQQLRDELLSDPAGREKRGLPPMKLTPQEEQGIARQGFRMAQQQLDYLLLAAQFPQMFRYPEQPPQ